MKNRTSPKEEMMAFLFGDVVSSTFEHKLREMVDLGEHIKGKVGFPEAHLVALIQENFPEPRL
jgi:hypothetical protein